MIDVSIVIVCMNNLKNLYPCLDSIRKYTKQVNYETFVVAYLFSKENLERVKVDYPWVIFIESNEIRGFAENNNIALRQAKGKYCFVLNDDTFHYQHVIDNLVVTLNSLPDEVAIISPKILNKDGSLQRCGRPKYDLWTCTLYGKKVNQNGIFETYNISGSCFLIKKDVFFKFGWFDERYFFCPEDIALSTILNENGYKCYVNSDIEMIHACGGTWSKIIRATKPASTKGSQFFFGRGKWYREFYYSLLMFIELIFRCCFWIIMCIMKTDEHKRTMLNANRNAIVALFSKETPKQLFIRYYNELSNG